MGFAAPKPLWVLNPTVRKAAAPGAARRVSAKVEWHPGGLYPRGGFIVTNMSRSAETAFMPRFPLRRLQIWHSPLDSANSVPKWGSVRARRGF